MLLCETNARKNMNQHWQEAAGLRLAGRLPLTLGMFEQAVQTSLLPAWLHLCQLHSRPACTRRQGVHCPAPWRGLSGRAVKGCLTQAGAAGACRWDWEMASDRFTDQHWRKSSQWATLLRPHAQLAVDDTDISPRFASHCFTYLPNITLALPAHVQVCVWGCLCLGWQAVGWMQLPGHRLLRTRRLCWVPVTQLAQVLGAW